MKLFLTWTVVVVVAVVFATAAPTGSQDADIGRLMQRKLDHAHTILEALIVEDFDALVESASALQILSEESGWFVLQTPEYTQRSAAFRQAAREIEVSAKDRNLEGAALGYVDMTLKCVQCHQLLRGASTAEDFGARVGETAQFIPLEWWKTVAVVVP